MDFNILEIANKIKENGGNLYIVGGAVRDEILGIKNNDEDYCVTGIESEIFEKLFPVTFSRGKSFKVYDLCGKEFAMARLENKVGKGHKEFEVTVNKNITIYEDLKRRDITINSIAKDVLTNEIIDPFGGVQDIKNKIIRATSECFKEDPLRVYRAARFASQLDFEIDDITLELMFQLKNELNELSKERVFNELRKALKTKRPSVFFEMLKKAKVLDIHFKPIYNLIGVEQPEKFHPEGDAYNHTMLAIDKCATLTSKEEIIFATLVHDLGKALTPKKEYPHHYGHDSKGVDEVIKFSNFLKVPNLWKECGKIACKEHMRGGLFDKMKIPKKVSFIENVYNTKLGLEGLEKVVESDRNCRGTKEDKIEFAKIGNLMIKEVNGVFLKQKFKIEEGKLFKEKLHEERVKWLKNYLLNCK